MSEAPVSDVLAVWDSREAFRKDSAVPIAGKDPVVQEVLAWATANLSAVVKVRRVCRVEFHRSNGQPMARVTCNAEDEDGNVILSQEKGWALVTETVEVELAAFPPAHLTGGQL